MVVCGSGFTGAAGGHGNVPVLCLGSRLSRSRVGMLLSLLLSLGPKQYPKKLGIGIGCRCCSSCLPATDCGRVQLLLQIANK